MSDIIKNLFKKTKKGKFSGLGKGHKLNEEAPQASGGPSSSRSKDVYRPVKRNDLSSEAKQAATAALARMENKEPKELNVSLAAIKAQARKELEAEMKLKDQSESSVANKETPEPKEHKLFAVEAVYFRCPLISEEVMSKVEWQGRIKQFLYEQMNFEEKGLTACLIIVNCNKKDVADNCKEIINKYLQNIINNPTEEKYRKIRLGNKVFCEKVQGVEGAMDFLAAAGFVEQKIDEDDFLVWLNDDEKAFDNLKELTEALNSAEIIGLEVDRNLQVLLPSQARRTDLPPEFYRLTPEEIKREQKLRSDAMEQASILKTKAMREREEARALSIYRFALIRVRFPDGIYIQGTFSVHDKLADVFEFTQSCMKHEEISYHLVGPSGHKMSREDDEKSLYDLRLIPNVVFSFNYDDPQSAPKGNFVKEELMMLIK